MTEFKRPLCSRCRQRAILKLTERFRDEIRSQEFLCENHWYETVDKPNAAYLAAIERTSRA